MSIRLAVRACLVLLWIVPAFASGAPQSAPAAVGASTRQVRVVRAGAKVVLDGKLDEAAWQQAPPAVDFLQRDPDEGKAPREATEVRLLYDDEAIYVGARMFDREPARIGRRLTRRDGEYEGMADAVQIALDPHHDGLTGALFVVTAAGSLRDAVLFNDEGDDFTWDAVWDASVSIDDRGWVAEMRIPLSQLRFPPAEHQVWGLNLMRYTQRTNEDDWWVLVPKKESGFVSRMGELSGLDGVRGRRHLDLLPYLTGRGAWSGSPAPGNPFDDGRTAASGAGLDAKWGFTSNMTLDATVNPDFGQVEVDPAVVNLSAFETFFEEKRPFFIEGAQAFDNFGRNGATGYMGFNRTNPTLFYSRRVGRSPQGPASGDFVDRPAATTILGAAKVTGKTARGWTVNLIDAVTSREYADTSTASARARTEIEPFSNYLASRARRDVGQRAGFGVLVTSVTRDLRAPALDARLAGSALVAGADGHLFLTGAREYVVTGSFSGSRVTGSDEAISRLQRSSARYYQRPDARHLSYRPGATSLSGWNLQTDFNRNSGTIRPNASLWAVSPGYEVNDAGFVMNVDRMGGHAALVLLKPTPDRVTRSRHLIVAKWNVWNFARDPVGNGLYASFRATLLNYWSIGASVHGGASAFSDRLTRGGPMMRTPGFRIVSADISGDARKMVVWSASGSYEAPNARGWSGEASASLTVRPSPTLSIEVGPRFTRQLNTTQYVRSVSDASARATFGSRYVFGEIDQTEFSMDTRVNLILSPRMSLQAYLQPLLSVGRYAGFKEAARPRAFDFARYGAEAGAIQYDEAAGVYRVQPGGDGAPFDFANPDFNFKSLRVNGVFRWEFRPGSTLYLVWTQQREDESRPGRFAFGRDFSSMLGATGDHIVMAKVSYWLSR